MHQTRGKLQVSRRQQTAAGSVGANVTRGSFVHLKGFVFEHHSVLYHSNTIATVALHSDYAHCWVFIDQVRSAQLVHTQCSSGYAALALSAAPPHSSRPLQLPKIYLHAASERPLCRPA
eukprot:COSAG02_NODE_6749_length_3385_cov_1.828058_1_plen_118_part_10